MISLFRGCSLWVGIEETRELTACKFPFIKLSTSDKTVSEPREQKSIYCNLKNSWVKSEKRKLFENIIKHFLGQKKSLEFGDPVCKSEMDEQCQAFVGFTTQKCYNKNETMQRINTRLRLPKMSNIYKHWIAHIVRVNNI